MLHYKLQIGCMVIVLLVLVLYFRERHEQKNVKRMKCFERLLIFSLLYFVLDIVTVYTVNHTDTVPVLSEGAAWMDDPADYSIPSAFAAYRDMMI